MTKLLAYTILAIIVVALGTMLGAVLLVSTEMAVRYL